MLICTYLSAADSCIMQDPILVTGGCNCFTIVGDNEVVCFSHTHMVGAGVEDYGHIGVMATRDAKTSTISGRGYRSKFRHEDETAYPDTI